MKKVYYGIGFSLILLTTRILFFLRDGTNDTIESFLIWTIFILSIGIIGYMVYLAYQVNGFVKRYSIEIITGTTIIVLDGLLLLFNSKNMELILPFAQLFTIGLILIVLSLFSFKWKRWIAVFIVMFSSVYVFGQDFYLSIFSDYFSFKDFLTIREGLEFSENSYQFSILHILIGCLMILSVYLISIQKFEISNEKRSFKQVIQIPIILFLLVNINATYPPKSARMYLSDHYIYQSVYSKDIFVSKFSTVNLFFRDLGGIIIPDLNSKKDLEFIDEYLSFHEKTHMKNDYSDVFEGKNLIIIVGESFDEIAISEELTPHIYQLKTEGLDFQNHYTPVFPRTTCDTEIILNTSIIPSIQDGPTCYVYNNNSYSNSIANAFRDKGYITTAMHSNNKEFYTRHLVYEGFGYDYFLGQHEIGLSDVEKRYDSLFFEYAKEDVIRDEPFFTMMITLSGHSPYEFTNLAVDEHYDKVDAFYGDTVPNEIKRYIAAQIEVDIMIGNIMDELSHQNKLDDTVILFTNDHYPYMIDKDLYDDYKGYTSQYMRNKGMLYIWNPGIEDHDITALSSSFDIVPIVNNLFGLEQDYNLYVGVDVLDTTQQAVVYFKQYAIFDGETYIKLDDESSNDHPKAQMARDCYDFCRALLKTNFLSS